MKLSTVSLILLKHILLKKNILVAQTFLQRNHYGMWSSNCTKIMPCSHC